MKKVKVTFLGFPGWHIECSAMSSKYLGKQFDIHTGGEEHISIHHTNEIAQSECAFGKKPWVRYWMHQRWLLDESGEKMSKSKGGILTLTELEKRNFSPRDFRYFVLLTRYRKPLLFSIERLTSAKNSLERLKNQINELDKDKKINKSYLNKFKDAINDDLNTPKALQVLQKLIKDKKAKGKYQTIKKFDEVLGLNLLKKEKIKIPREIKELAEKRLKARKNKNWKLSDELRDKINKLGFIINDTKEGYEIKRE